MPDRHVFTYVDSTLVLSARVNLFAMRYDIVDEYTGMPLINGIDNIQMLKHRAVFTVSPLFIEDLNTIMTEIEYRLKLESAYRVIQSQAPLKAKLNENLQPIV
jgi:hypothetical protein